VLLGPVFRAELIRTSRRRRYYVLRVVYGVVLWLLLWEQYLILRALELRRFGGISIKDMADFAFETFVAFSAVQLSVILALVPALVGGVIADEKQRKTLSFLLASQLTSSEIVLDKLAARMLHVGMLVAVGLPVIFILSLFGGIAPEHVLATYALTCSTTFLAAALALLVSTFARRVRQAVLIAYVVEVAWLLGPPLLGFVLRVGFPLTYARLGPVWISLVSPLELLVFRSSPFLMTVLTFNNMAWMFGLQIAAGTLFVVLAVRGLRPIFRQQETGTRRLDWFGSKLHHWRWLQRPSCGDHAVLWKERYFARTDIFTKMFVLPATVVLTVVLILGSGIDEAVMRVCHDLFHQGYAAAQSARLALNAAIRSVSHYYIGLWLLAVAGASASSVSAEREEDTWLSLVATPLSGREILRGKMVGAVWGLRGFGGLFSLIWLAGLVTGAVHPLGFLAALAVLGLLTWFVTALGTFFSLRARSTSRAITATIVTFIVLNCGYAIFLMPFLNNWQWQSLNLGFTPSIVAKMLFSGSDLEDFSSLVRVIWSLDNPQGLSAWIEILILYLYAIAALTLTHRSIVQFDALLGRPRLLAGRTARSLGGTMGRKARKPQALPVLDSVPDSA